MTPTAPPVARSGTRKLSEVTRHLVQPSGIVRTGWPAVAQTCREKLGIRFDRWQDGAGRLILAEREDGSLASTVGGVGMSLPRQVGKTYLLAGMIFGLCINKPGLLVIWSAHHAKTHNETFLAMQALARRSKVAAYVDKVYTGSGDEEVRFHNGSRILFGARERGFGRGIPGVDILVMDEGQILSERAMDNMLATLNTSRFGLHLYVGTPPKPEDNSESFRQMRAEALSGKAEDMVWVECGADPDARPDDREQWAKANPSYPHRTPAQSILRLRKKLSPLSFLREGLGIWDDVGGSAIFGEGRWEACAAAAVTLSDPRFVAHSLAVACSFDLSRSAIVGAGRDDADVVHVKPIQHGPGTAWVVDRAKELQDAQGVDVVIDGKGPAAVLIPHLERAGVRLRVLNTGNVLDACADTYNRVADGRLEHGSYPELNAAVAAAVQRPVGDRWALGRKQSASDISTLEGAVLAAYPIAGASKDEPTPRIRVIGG